MAMYPPAGFSLDGIALGRSVAVLQVDGDDARTLEETRPRLQRNRAPEAVALVIAEPGDSDLLPRSKMVEPGSCLRGRTWVARQITGVSRKTLDGWTALRCQVAEWTLKIDGGIGGARVGRRCAQYGAGAWKRTGKQRNQARIALDGDLRGLCDK